MKLRKNDKVVIISGTNRGKSGTIAKVLPKESRIIVEGVNLRKRHAKPTPKNPKGGIVEFAAAFDASNAQLVCPSCNKPTRIKFKLTDDSKIRVCGKCGNAIDNAAKSRKSKDPGSRVESRDK